MYQLVKRTVSKEVHFLPLYVKKSLGTFIRQQKMILWFQLSTAWMYLESTNPNKVTKYFSFSPQKNKSPWSSAPGISTVNDTIRAWPYSAYMTRFISPEQFDKVSQAIDNFYAKEPYYHQSPPVKARNTYNSFTAINHVLRAGGNLQLLDEPYFPDKSSASLGTVSIQLMFVTVAAILAFHWPWQVKIIVILNYIII